MLGAMDCEEFDSDEEGGGSDDGDGDNGGNNSDGDSIGDGDHNDDVDDDADDDDDDTGSNSLRRGRKPRVRGDDTGGAVDPEVQESSAPPPHDAGAASESVRAPHHMMGAAAHRVRRNRLISSSSKGSR